MEKRVLMVAFHYPPCHGSSGLQRTLAFTRYLADYGWQPAVLTVSPSAYETTSDALLDAVPSDVVVRRVFALDTARHLSVRGRYPTRLALPDRWASWRFGAKHAAMKMIRTLRPAAVWSTFPIATAHTIGASVAKASGLPWIADMRDPMVEFDPHTGLDFPEDPAVREARLRVETSVMRTARRVVFCTQGAHDICQHRYGQSVAGKFSIIPNGFDESEFHRVETDIGTPVKQPGFTLLHSGTVYPGSDRGPEGLFEALQTLAGAHELPVGFQLAFRAPGHVKYLEDLIRSFGLSSIVRIEPQLSYREALREMLGSSGLLVIQGPSSNPAIPAKLYEYFRARKPLFCLVHPEGDTAGLLRELGAGIMAPPDAADRIANALREFFARVRDGDSLTVADTDLPRFSRSSQAGDLALLLDSI